MRHLPAKLIDRLPFHYGWLVLACVCCAGFSRQGPAVATLSIFVEPLTAEFGWSRTALSGAVSLGGVLAALASALIGPSLDRKGARIVLCLAVLSTAAATMLLSLTSSLLVFYLLWMNGAVIGAMSWLHHENGLALEWYSWILPHGVTELLAIILCGAAGLVVGQAIVFPGREGRLESLRQRGGEAGFIVVGAVFMLFLAGLIEGVFRQRVQDLSLRYLLALVTSIFWILYFGWVGRREA